MLTLAARRAPYGGRGVGVTALRRPSCQGHTRFLSSPTTGESQAQKHRTETSPKIFGDGKVTEAGLPRVPGPPPGGLRRPVSWRPTRLPGTREWPGASSILFQGRIYCLPTAPPGGHFRRWASGAMRPQTTVLCKAGPAQTQCPPSSGTQDPRTPSSATCFVQSGHWTWGVGFQSPLLTESLAGGPVPATPS